MIYPLRFNLYQNKSVHCLSRCILEGWKRYLCQKIAWKHNDNALDSKPKSLSAIKTPISQHSLEFVPKSTVNDRITKTNQINVLLHNDQNTNRNEITSDTIMIPKYTVPRRRRVLENRPLHVIYCGSLYKKCSRVNLNTIDARRRISTKDVVLSIHHKLC